MPSPRTHKDRQAGFPRPSLPWGTAAPFTFVTSAEQRTEGPSFLGYGMKTLIILKPHPKYYDTRKKRAEKPMLLRQLIRHSVTHVQSSIKLVTEKMF